MYSIKFKKSAVKELDRLPSKAVKNILIAIENLAVDPRPNGCKKLKGSTDNVWRIRIGDYRVLYGIDDVISIVDIQRIGHRRDIYQ